MLMYTDNYYMILIAAIFSIGSITGGDRTGISSIEIPIISKLVKPKLVKLNWQKLKINPATLKLSRCPPETSVSRPARRQAWDKH